MAGDSNRFSVPAKKKDPAIQPSLFPELDTDSSPSVKPRKKSPAKPEVTKSSTGGSVQAKKPVPAKRVIKGEKSVKKTTSPKAKLPTEKKKDEPLKAKKPLVPFSFPPQQPSQTKDLSRMNAEERHKAVLGESATVKKKEGKKPERPKIDEDRILIENIRKVQKAKVARVVIPPVGKRRGRQLDILPYLLPFLTIIIIILFILVIVRVKKASSPLSQSVSAESEMKKTVSADDSFHLEIVDGMSATAVATALSPLFPPPEFLAYLAEHGLTGQIKSGVYYIALGSSIADVGSAITRKTDTNAREFLVYDGYTLADIDAALANRGLAEPGAFLKATEEIRASEGLSFAEGWFLSGLFKLSQDNTASKLAREMHTGVLDYFRSHAAALSSSPYSIEQLLIMASMIGRETKDVAQMGIIAGIIDNRMASGMPLGIDATTRYEKGNWTDPIPQKVFEKDTPYNTRRKPGLPPSGIGCVSPAMLDAVLYPVLSADFYYCHDKKGNLFTAKTYEAHLDNVEKAR